VPDFVAFSSLLRITTKYEMPTVRSQLLEVIRDAYPATFEGIDPSKAHGDNIFSGSTPYPNAVLNLFIQQDLASALPMAYHTAVWRGPDSLMNARFRESAWLPPEILRMAIKDLIALREMELRETRRLVFGPKGSQPRSWPNRTPRTATGPGVSEIRQKIVDLIIDSVHSGTKLFQVLSLRCVEGILPNLAGAVWK